MKKTLLLLFAFVAAFAASAQTFTEDLVVSVNGNATEPMPTTFTLAQNANGTFRFELKNFVLVAGEDEIPVGNIALDNVVGVKRGNITYLSTEQEILLDAGDAPQYAMWVGPDLGEVPVVLDGCLSGTRVFVHIDIDMSETLSQVIKVDLGSEEAVGIAPVACAPAASTAIYTLDGRRVARATAHGLYIVNGQKVIR